MMKITQILFIILTTSLLRSAGTIDMNNNIEAIKIIDNLEWSLDFPLKEVVRQFDERAAFIEVPGPKSIPVRSHLETYCSNNRIVGRLVDGNGNVAPLVVIAQNELKIVHTVNSPLGINMRSDGKIWVLSKELLALYDTEGNELKRIQIEGHFLLGGKDNSVWVLEGARDIARLVNENGEIEGEFVWKNGLNTCSTTDGSLSRIEGGKLHTINRKGEINVISTKSDLDKFQTLLWFDKTGFICTMGTTYYKYNSKGVLIKQINIQGAGLTDKGEAFISGKNSNYVNLWSSSGIKKSFLLEPHVADMAWVTVVAVEEERVLIYGQDYAAWYRGQNIEDSFEVNDFSYKKRIFPRRCELPMATLTAVSAEGNLIVSSSSSKGITLLEVCW